MLSMERVKPQLSIKELSDPNSRNYVPHPYPKTRNQVITDFKYGLKHHFLDDNEDVKENETVYERVLPQLLKNDSSFRFGRVYRVYNELYQLAYEFHHVLEILDANGSCWGHAAVSAEGLIMAISLRVEPLTMGASLSPEKVRNLFKMAVINSAGAEKNQLRRICYTTLAPRPWAFSWRFKANGDEYYLQDSPMERKLYKVQSRREWRLDRKSNDDMADFVHSLPKGDRMILDSINDQVIVVRPVKIDIEKLLKEIDAG